MRSAVFCYAAVDADSAGELASYLELNCSLLVSLEEGRIESGDDMLEAAGRALSADHPILLLSPYSVPSVWKREEWEPVLLDEAHELGRQVTYVLLRPCNFPQLFRRKGFFDLSEHWLTGQRALRRWLLRHDAFLQRATNVEEEPAWTAAPKPVFDELEKSLLDEPGIRAGIKRDAALAFARAHTEDFEGVFRLSCAYLSRAGIIGQLAYELGLSLRGPVEENAERLHEFLASRRLLLVFEHVARSDIAFIAVAGKTSFLFVIEDTLPRPASLETTAALFADWRSQQDACLGELGDAHWHVGRLQIYGGADRQSAVSLASRAASLLSECGRLAEAFEFLEMTRDAVRSGGDLFVAARLEWEMSWIRDEWGEPTSPGAQITFPAQPIQLTLALT